MNSFYHSAYTSDGFRNIRLTSFNPDCFRYILKGKSHIVKKNLFNSIIKELDKKGVDFAVGRNYTGNITAVRCDDLNFLICDGTYPFKEEAVTYGATDGVISLENFQNRNELRRRSSEIVTINQEIVKNERRCCRFLNAAAGICKDQKHLGKDNIDSRKVSRYTAKLWSSMGCPPSGKVGIEKSVFMTVLTSNGLASSTDELYDYCDTAIAIEDVNGYCRDMIIDRIRRYALSSGVDIISCRSFLGFNSVPEHIIMPSLRFGIFSNVKEIRLAVPSVKKVRSKRFEINEPGESVTVRLQFNQRAINSLLKEAEHSLKLIDKYNSELDDIYINATDEKALRDFLISEVFSRRSVI